MILPRNFVFQNIKITSKKAEFKNLDDSEVFSSDFPGPETSAASMASTASFHQNTFNLKKNIYF